METDIKTQKEQAEQVLCPAPLNFYNPTELDFTSNLKVRAVELSDAYTRIDFLYKAPMHYENGGWVQMAPDSYIRPAGSDIRYPLIKAVNIPYAPQKKFFNRCGEYLNYTLFFAAIPGDTAYIDIIEKEAPGYYFNFYKVAFSEWLHLNHDGKTYTTRKATPDDMRDQPQY